MGAQALAARDESCEDRTTQEIQDDFQTTAATRSAPETVAGTARRHSKRASGISSAGNKVHTEFDGAGKRADQSSTAGTAIDTTRPLDATRELATAVGALTYSEVAECVAVKIVDVLGIESLKDNSLRGV